MTKTQHDFINTVELLQETLGKLGLYHVSIFAKAVYLSESPAGESVSANTPYEALAALETRRKNEQALANWSYV